MTTTSDSSARPMEIVDRFLTALAGQNFDGAAALLHEAVVYQNVPFPADRGKEAVVRRLKSFERLVNKFEVRILNIAENGPIVLTERVDVLSGPWVYLDLWVCGTFEVRDARIILWRDYFDLAETGAKLAVGPLRRLLGLAG